MFALHWFGGASLIGETGPVTGPIAQRRRLALLALLTTAPTGAVSRDKLIALLWPDEDREHARHLLADSVFTLRKGLGKESILTIGDDLLPNPEVLRSDVGQFRDALSTGDLERVVELYRGPLLDGFFVTDAPELERWIETERERLAREYGEALEKLAGERERVHDYAGALQWWRRAAAHDRFSSRVAKRLIQASIHAGDTAGAVQHARIHRVLLREELGVEPDPELASLEERLSSGDAPAPGAASAPELPPPRADVPSGPDPTLGEAGPTDAPSPVPSRSTRPGAAEPAIPRRWTGSRHRVAYGAVVAVVLALAAYLSLRWAVDRARGPTAVESIAVLPIANLTGDPELDYIGDGMAEELIGALARLDGLKIPARTSAFQFRGGAADVREIGNRLGVQAVLEGSVRRSGDRLRIVAQLVDATTGYHLWRGDFNRRLEDVLAIQEEIALSVASALQATLPRLEGGALWTGAFRPDAEAPSLAHRGGGPAATNHAPDPEAHLLYLKGRFVWNRWSGADQARALEFFRQAIARDSLYAKPYAGLADTYVVLGSSGYLPGAEAFAAAKPMARKAIQLDGTLAEAHASLAAVLAWERDFAGAEAEFRKAIALNPSYPTAHHGYAMLLAMRGQMDAALREIRTAEQLDPLSLSINQAHGLVLYLSRDYAAAIEQATRTLELEPEFPWALDVLGVSYSMLERHREAVHALEEASAAAPDDPEILTDLAIVHARQGRTGRAREILTRLEHPGTGEPDAFRVGQIYAALGEAEIALDWLERARWDMLSLVLMRADPFLDPVRTDPRFLRLLHALGLSRDPA